MVLMSDNVTGVAYVEKRGHYFLSDVRSGTRDPHLADQSRYLSHLMLHLGEEEYSCQLASSVVWTKFFQPSGHFCLWCLMPSAGSTGCFIDLFATRVNTKSKITLG